MKILITGGTHGMGKGVAKALAASENQSHEIILLCRSEELGQQVIVELMKGKSNHTISLVLCDLAKLNDVKSAIREIKNRHQYLDALFINAGLGYAAGRTETTDGFESHFQVNYLSQFMLTLQLLSLLEVSEFGGRVIFNVTHYGDIFWDDLQMKDKWNFEKTVLQAMAAKRLFLTKLHRLYSEKKQAQVSFVGFEIHKTVWSNQINIIPLPMKMMAKMMKLIGLFITIEKCGVVMAPLFTENPVESLRKSGKLVTWKAGKFVEMNKKMSPNNPELQDKLWNTSLELCNDDETQFVARRLQNQLV